jgi:hypothetical protein
LELFKSIITDLVATSISLAGFVLASLTIIVAFKDNLSLKDIASNQSGLEILFASKHYKNIVGVFTGAVVIFLFHFLFLSVSKLFIGLFSKDVAIYVCLIPIITISLTVFRSVLILYSIIKLQTKE